MTSQIELRSLSKSFGTRTLWSNVNLTIPGGSVTGLVGASGSGKSTLLNCIGLLDQVTSGQILVDGADITRLRSSAERLFRRDKLGYLFQNYALIDNESALSNVAIARPGLSRRRHRVQLLAALEQVGLAAQATRPVYQLSGGEQQRVALARLIVKEPTIILADEPTGALDQDNAAMVIRMLRRFADRGVVVLVATHSEYVAGSCDRVWSVGEGRPAQAERNACPATQSRNP